MRVKAEKVKQINPLPKHTEKASTKNHNTFFFLTESTKKAEICSNHFKDD